MKLNTSANLLAKSAMLFAGAVVVLIAAFMASGCTRNDNTDKAVASTCLIRVLGTFSIFETEPLVVQVSEGSKAYIWQFSDKLELKNNDAFEGKRVPASTLDDVQAQSVLYKQAQDRQGKPAPMVLSGDNHAKCGAIFETITKARRAGITAFYFDPLYRISGQTNTRTSFLSSPREGELEDPVLKMSPSGKPAKITIFKDNTIAWDDQPVTLNDYVDRLLEISKTIPRENIRFVVEVDAQADFALLRYAFDQMRRMMYGDSITIELARRAE